MTLSSTVRSVALAALAYTLLTLAYSWPLPMRLMHGVAHDPGDPILNAWILWWTTKAVPLTEAWWNAPMFYPAVGTFAFSEHLLGQAIIAAPLIALTGSPLFGYNVTLLATYVLSGLGAYFLAYTLTKRHDASFVAGLAFAFAPYRLAQLPHIQVLTSFWTPICLGALHRYDREPSARWAALAAGAWLMQSLSNGYYMFFLTVLLAVWFAWFAIGRWSLAQLARLAGFFAVAGVVLLPVILGYKEILKDTYGFSRDLGTIRDFSADVGALLHASDELWLWGWVHAVRRAEGELFPGPAIVVLSLFAVFAARPFAASIEPTRTRWWLRRIFAVLFAALVVGATLPAMYGSWRLTIGGVRLVSIARADKPLTLAVFALIAWMMTLPRVSAALRRRSFVLFYGFAAFAMWAFTLGPDPEFFGHRAIYQAPYGWLMRLPGFDGLRVPARFWMMTLACLSVLAAFAIQRLRGRARQIVTAAAAIAILLDGWPREFSVRAEPERRPTPPNVATRLDLPMTDDRDALALYQQTFDSVPLNNGFSGYGAPHQYAMRELLLASDHAILRALAARGPLGVVIDHESDPEQAYRKFVASYPGAVRHETHPTWSSYVIGASEGGDLLPDRAGEAVPIKTVTAFPSQPNWVYAVDSNLKTRWSGGIQKGPADFTIELQGPSRVRQLVIALGEFYTDFPIELRLEVSSDGSAWDVVYRGSTALHAYYAALRHPKEVPVVYPIERENVRFIRMTQLGWGTHDWSIPEVRVLR
jgi:hypothetical protein